jgi:hypothetical protein
VRANNSILKNIMLQIIYKRIGNGRYSRKVRCAGHVARTERETKVFGVLVGTPEARRPLGRARHRWEDGIRLYIRKTGREDGEDPVGSGHEPMADSCKYGDETSGSGATE